MNTKPKPNEPRLDMVSALLTDIEQYSLGERLRLAAGLLDDAKAGRSDPRKCMSHARTIVGLVDKQIKKALEDL